MANASIYTFLRALNSIGLRLGYYIPSRPQVMFMVCTPIDVSSSKNVKIDRQFRPVMGDKFYPL